MTSIYCHVLTPVNIQADSQCFILPIVYNKTLYVIKERALQDTLEKINYLYEYFKFVKEFGYKNAYKWLNKKGLLNEGFLESVSSYYLKNIDYKQAQNYLFFRKDEEQQPFISEEYLKNICEKAVIYNYIKEKRDIFNCDAEEKLDIIEIELSSLKNETTYKQRQNYYKKNIFKFLLENYITDLDYHSESKINDIRNLKFEIDSYINKNELYIYKTGNINNYKDFNFKLTDISYKECLRGNSFIKFKAFLNSKYSDNYYTKSVLEQLKEDLNDFTCDKINFGAKYLKKIMGYQNNLQRKKIELLKYAANGENNSNVSLLQKTQTIISNTENHIISQYQSLKNHSNIYFGEEDELLKNIAILNLDKTNLKRINSLLKEKSYYAESDLLKFTFNNSNLPYSAYGFASINF